MDLPCREWATYKRTWRGEYRRLLRITGSEALATLDPCTKRVTNTVQLADILSVDVQHEHELVFCVTAESMCGQLCGLLRRELRFAMASPAQAAAASSAIRRGLTRHLTEGDTEQARAVAAEAASVSAVPSEQLALPHTKTNHRSDCLLYTSPSPRDRQKSRMPSSA